jgi:hypothetical protein
MTVGEAIQNALDCLAAAGGEGSDVYEDLREAMLTLSLGELQRGWISGNPNFFGTDYDRAFAVRDKDSALFIGEFTDVLQMPRIVERNSST